MIPKSVQRFSEKIMLNKSMIPKSVQRFSEKIMLNKSMKVHARTRNQIGMTIRRKVILI
jgi:hypothetical protein